MKVFLGNAPWKKEGYYGVRAGSRWPHFEKESHSYMPFPFFLAYAAALLEKNNFDVLLVDGVAERIGEAEFFNRIKTFQPDLIVLEVSTVSIDVDLEIARKLRKNLSPDIKIAFSGLHYGMYNEEFLRQYEFIDFVLKGEYEYTLLELTQCLNKGVALDGVIGLIYRDFQGAIHDNPRRPPIQDLDNLPWPARHLLPKDRYEDLPGILPKPTAQMWASRDCPYQCIFCAWPQIMYRENRYRVRNSADVVDEMAYLVKEQGFKSVYFDDDIFGIGRERTLKICQEIKKRNLDILWAIMARADTLDEETLKAMVDSGLRAVKYGVESGAQELINNAGKNLNLKRVAQTVKITKELGINVHLTFMFGLPGETRDTIKRTIDFALQLDPDSLQFSIATPFPGSKYFEMLDERGYIVSKNFQDYDGYSRAVIRTESLSPKDLEEALSYAYETWQRHLFWRTLKRNRSKYLVKGICHPIRGFKRVIELL